MPRNRNRRTPSFLHKRRGRPATFSEPFTDQLIADLKPREREYSVHDSNVPGLSVRVLPSGTTTYIYRPSRSLDRSNPSTLGRTTEMTVAEARAKVRERERQIEQGLPAKAFARPQMTRTFAAVAEMYLKSAGSDWSPEWRKKVTLRFSNCMLPELGSLNLADITAKDVNRAVRHPSSAPRTQRQDFYITSAMLTWAVQTGRIERNVLKGTLPPVCPLPRRPVHLDMHKLTVIWRECCELPSPWSDIYRLCILTGQPMHEVLRAKDTHLVAHGRAWGIGDHRSYGDLRHLQSLGPFALRIFADRAGCNGYLFAKNPNGTPLVFRQPVLNDLRYQCGVGNFTCSNIQGFVAAQLAAFGGDGERWERHLLRTVDELDPMKDVIL